VSGDDVVAAVIPADKFTAKTLWASFIDDTTNVNLTQLLLNYWHLICNSKLKYKRSTDTAQKNEAKPKSHMSRKFKLNNMKKISIYLMLIVTLSIATKTINAQDYTEQAKTFFGKYLTSSQMEDIIMKSLPTVEDCKLIFKGSNAYTYFGMIEDMKKQFQKPANNESYSYVRVEQFSTQDIEQDKGNYAGGMKNIVDKLQPYVIFYQIKLLKGSETESRMSLKYWVNINGRWVYFPKPYAAFE